MDLPEIERLRNVERMARDVYDWLSRNGMHTTGHGRGLAEALGITEVGDDYPGKDDAA